MTGERCVDDVKRELATAVGFLALTDATVQEAAQEAGVTRLELEECLQATALAEALGVEFDTDVTERIDRVFEENSP